MPFLWCSLKAEHYLIAEMEQQSAFNWIEYNPAVPVGISAVSAIIFMLILLNNIIVLYTLKQASKLKPIQCLMVSLAVADLLTLLPYGVITVTIASGKIVMTPMLCTLQGLLRITTIGTTVWIHCAMCAIKFFAVVAPTKYCEWCRKTTSKKQMLGLSIFCFVFPWILGTLLSLLQILEFDFSPFEAGCKFTPGIYSTGILVIVFVAIPLSVQFITHAIVIVKVRELRSANRRRVLQIVKVVTITLILFYLCFTPALVSFFVRDVMKMDQTPGWLQTIVTHSVTLNSAVSGPIYFSCVPIFQKVLPCYRKSMREIK